MNFAISVFIVFLGASLGSFLSVAIYRIKKNKKGIIFGRSSCPYCKKKLAPKDLIPLLSYVLLRGKCRYCKKKLSPVYFFLEFSMGLLGLLLYFKFPFLLNSQIGFIGMDWHNIALFALYFIYSLILIGIFFYDLQYMEIPDIFLMPLIGITFLGSLLVTHLGFWNMLSALTLALFFFGGQIIISKGKWLGTGDLYLGIAMAFLLGWPNFIVSIVITYCIGATISIILLLSKKLTANSKVPFAPFLVLGTFSAIFFGETILNWYLSFLTL